MIGCRCPFLPKTKYQAPELSIFWRKSIIGQFLWPNGLGDWSANFLNGDHCEFESGGGGLVELFFKKKLGEPLFCWGVVLGLVMPLGQFPPNVAVGLLASVRVLYARNL